MFQLMRIYKILNYDRNTDNNYESLFSYPALLVFVVRLSCGSGARLVAESNLLMT